MKKTLGTADKRFDALESGRNPYILRAREAAKLTLPSLMPPSGSRGSTKLPTPFQGIGARGVNNLASKLLLALFPPNSPFFRMQVDNNTVEEMSDDPALKTKIEKALGKYERTVMSEIESYGDRVQMFEALKHLIVTGNVLLHIGKKGIRVFHLDRYVCKRDEDGYIIEIVAEEHVFPEQLPKEIRDQVKEVMKEEGDEKSASLYTHIKRENGKYVVYQEAEGIKVPGSEGSYPLDKTPWLALRWTRVDGEDYGRGFIEEYMGDLTSLEKLTKALVEGSVAAAKVIFLLDPNGTTKARSLSKTTNGGFATGSAQDVSVLQLEKFNDFRVARDTMNDIQERLSQAFLLHSSVQRNAERVTATEIRYMASELEDALGGVYSTLSLELQLPYVTRRIAVLERKGDLPRLPKDIAKPAIVTGLEALGRGHDLQKLDLFIQGLRETFGDQVIVQHMNVRDYISRRATAVGVDTEGLIKSEEQIQQEQEAAQQQQMMQQLSPEMMKQAGSMMTKGMENNQNGSA